jgi:hypothetical protein
MLTRKDTRHHFQLEIYGVPTPNEVFVDLEAQHNLIVAPEAILLMEYSSLGRYFLLRS